MRNLFLLLVGIAISTILHSCMQDGAFGATVASQLTGTYTSSVANIMVDNTMVVDSTEGYNLQIVEVDANTVTVLSPDLSKFEVDLEKSENGEWTTGKSNGASSGFTFKYYAPDATLNIVYASGNDSLHFTGTKE